MVNVLLWSDGIMGFLVSFISEVDFTRKVSLHFHAMLLYYFMIFDVGKTKIIGLLDGLKV